MVHRSAHPIRIIFGAAADRSATAPSTPAHLEQLLRRERRVLFPPARPLFFRCGPELAGREVEQRQIASLLIRLARRNVSVTVCTSANAEQIPHLLRALACQAPVRAFRAADAPGILGEPSAAASAAPGSAPAPTLPTGNADGGSLEPLYSADLHTHCLGHRYYGGIRPAELARIPLTEEEKARVERFLYWNIRQRHLDVLAITDHDDLRAALYGAALARERRLPLRVLPGAECEVTDPEGAPGAQRIHLLVYGLACLPDYGPDIPAQQFAAEVRRQGGTVVLAHPAYYPATFPRLAPLLHGYERRNKNGFPFEPAGCSLPCFSNSDLHWQDEQDGWEQPVPLYCNYLTRRQLALFEG